MTVSQTARLKALEQKASSGTRVAFCIVGIDETVTVACVSSSELSFEITRNPREAEADFRKRANVDAMQQSRAAMPDAIILPPGSERL